MYNFPIDKELFQDTLGLSCVENLLIYALRSANLAYPCLFYHSHLSLPEIIHEFTVNRSSYAAFCAVERIQNLAVQNGLLEMELLPSLTEDLYSAEDAWLMVMLTPEAMKEKYHTDMWRDDHYILLGNAEGEKITYFNDTPRDIGTITRDELKRIFGGRVIRMRLTGKPFDRRREDYLKELYHSLQDKSMDVQLDYFDMAVLRDILGILRILRKRVMKFASLYTDVGEFHTYLDHLDKQYTNLEYRRLRKRVDLQYNEAVFDELLEEDKKWVYLMKEKLTSIMEAFNDDQ